MVKRSPMSPVPAGSISGAETWPSARFCAAMAVMQSRASRAAAVLSSWRCCRTTRGKLSTATSTATLTNATATSAPRDTPA